MADFVGCWFIIFIVVKFVPAAGGGGINDIQAQFQPKINGGRFVGENTCEQYLVVRLFLV